MRVEATQPRTEDTNPVLRRILRIVSWLAAIALLLFVLDQLGVPVSGWIHDFFDQLRAVPAYAIAGGIVLGTLQTVLAAVAWLTILRAAFPDTHLPFRPVLASYAVAVALNGFLPANIGTLVMLLMFTTLIASATFAVVFSGFIVQKIPFSVLNVAAYLYLFATVAGSLSIKLGFVAEHPVASALIALGGVVLLLFLGRFFWVRATKFREQVKTGGAILGQPRRFLIGVALPELGSYLARLGIVAVFMAAYSIPVSFHSVVAVSASNSISNGLSVTPGGAGVNQAFNVAVLDSTTSSANAAAYSLAQQLIISAWDVMFAIVLVSWVFGWSGGKQLVRQSYAEAESRNASSRLSARRGGPLDVNDGKRDESRGPDARRAFPCGRPGSVTRQESARSSAARSVGVPCAGSTNSTGSASSGRIRLTTCSRVTPPRSQLVQRKARSEVGEGVARNDRVDTLDPQDEVVVLAACVCLDPDPKPVTGRVPVHLTAAVVKPLEVRAAITGLLGRDGVLVHQVLHRVRRRREHGGLKSLDERFRVALVPRAVRTITGSRSRASVSSATGTASGSKSSNRSPSSTAYDETSRGHR